MGLLGKLFGQKQGLPSGPSGWRGYAVGDVHGRLDLLRLIVDSIVADTERRGATNNLLVFLGDLIDRGPESARVIEYVRTLQLPGFRIAALAGNHEEALLRIMNGDEELVPTWLRVGGAECLESYGVDVDLVRGAPPREAVRRIAGAIPDDHAAFLHDMADTFRFGDYLFVHAGIRPGIPLEAQSQQDLRWIRGDFLHDRRDHGMIVVHGHTISEQVDEHANRIGIDTGAYATGVLTAIGIEGSKRWFIQAADAHAPAPAANAA